MVEASHQSVVMGGPCYILNKAATAERLALLSSRNNIELSPIFFIADYDIVQPELTNIRTPLMGQGGISLVYQLKRGMSSRQLVFCPYQRMIGITR